MLNEFNIGQAFARGWNGGLSTSGNIMNEQNILIAIKQLNNDCYGLQIKKQIKLMFGESISLGKLYCLLNSLEEKGLVSSHEGEATSERGGRKRKYFKIRPNLLA